VRALEEQRRAASGGDDANIKWDDSIPGAVMPVDGDGNRTGFATWVKRADAPDIPDYVWCRIPEPTGWRMVVQEYAPPKVSKGGVHFADSSQDWHKTGNFLGRVLAMAPVCYRHPKFLVIDDQGMKLLPGPWCAVGEWVVFQHYAGTARRIEHEGVEWRFRYVHDDAIEATAPTPDGLKVYA